MVSLPGDEDFVAPALYEHCCRTYKAMLDQASPVVQNLGAEEDDGVVHRIIVYEGFLTQLITGELNLSVPYYTSVRQALLNMGCIRQLRRGGGTSPSQWELIYEPTIEGFMRQRPPKIKKQTREEAWEEMIDNLSARLNKVEKQNKQILAGLAAHFGTEPQGGES